jgi:hypothetical protein
MFEKFCLVGWVVAGVLAALLFSGIVAVGPAPGQIEPGFAGKQGQDQQQDTGDDSQATADEKKQKTGTKREPECSKSQSPEDCRIQLWMARATQKQADIALWSGIVSGLTLLATGVAAAAAIAAVVYSARAAAAASDAAAQTGISAAAATKSADIAERALRGIERPYLFVKIESVRGLKRATIDTPSKPTLAYNIINQGKTPAILRSLAVRLQDSPKDPLRLPMGLVSKFYEVVAAGEYVSHPPGGRIVEVEGSAGGQRYDDAILQRLVFHGSIHYEDPTGAYHTDRFCLRANKDGTFSLAGPEYNWRKTEQPKEQPDETDT